ncbi:MAG: CBS domain-containing protein [Phycisphaerales bacterium]|nr:MAG: CBS domain-containing protein [Phycisphaerales bacterium]
MPRIEDLLKAKAESSAPTVVSVRPDESTLVAAKRMNEHRIGSLVVLDDRSHLTGIISERDILTRVVASERDATRTRVAEIMTRDVITCAPEDRLQDLRRIMRERRVRHVPVVRSGRVVGMVSIGDLNAAEAGVMSETIKYLEQYMTAL